MADFLTATTALDGELAAAGDDLAVVREQLAAAARGGHRHGRLAQPSTAWPTSRNALAGATPFLRMFGLLVGGPLPGRGGAGGQGRPRRRRRRHRVPARPGSSSPGSTPPTCCPAVAGLAPAVTAGFDDLYAVGPERPRRLIAVLLDRRLASASRSASIPSPSTTEARPAAHVRADDRPRRDRGGRARPGALAGPGRRSRRRLRHRPLGRARRSDRRPALPRHHRLEPALLRRPLVADAFKVWNGGLGIPGGIAAGVGVGVWVAHRRGMRLGRRSRRHHPRHPARPGHRPPRQLVEPGALRPARPPCRGASRSTPSTGRSSTPRYGHVPPHVPLRDVVEPGAVRPADLDRPHAGASAPATSCPLYIGGYFLGRLWIEAMRIDTATKILGIRVNIWLSIVGIGGAVDRPRGPGPVAPPRRRRRALPRRAPLGRPAGFPSTRTRTDTDEADRRRFGARFCRRRLAEGADEVTGSAGGTGPGDDGDDHEVGGWRRRGPDRQRRASGGPATDLKSHGQLGIEPVGQPVEVADARGPCGRAGSPDGAARAGSAASGAGT